MHICAHTQFEIRYNGSSLWALSHDFAKERRNGMLRRSSQPAYEPLQLCPTPLWLKWLSINYCQQCQHRSYEWITIGLLSATYRDRTELRFYL